MKLFGFLLFFTFLCPFVFSQDAIATKKIKTSAECNMCKDRLENELNYIKGIVFAELDVPSKILTVRYKTKKINLDDIKQLISKIGYDADETLANPEAVSKLPKCCQPGGMGN